MAENLEILREHLGIDISTEPPERVRQLLSFAASISSSPYPSPEMLASYAAQGFPELVQKVIAVIDEQRSHRMALEAKRTSGSETRQDRAQWSAILIGFFGVAGALVAGYFGVPAAVCIVVALISVGGPNTATVISRMLDRVDRMGR